VTGPTSSPRYVNSPSAMRRARLSAILGYAGEAKQFGIRRVKKSDWRASGRLRFDEFVTERNQNASRRLSSRVRSLTRSDHALIQNPVDGLTAAARILGSDCIARASRVPRRAARSGAVSGGHRNASSSACDGVFHPRVCRGRPLSSAATVSRSAWV
jgi:hypothetical protein